MRKKLKTIEQLKANGWKGTHQHLVRGNHSMNDTMLSNAGKFIDVEPNTIQYIRDYDYWDGYFFYTEDMFERPKHKRNLPDWF